MDKLKKEGSLDLVDTSEEISKSYLIKNDKCMRVAELAFGEDIYENAVSEAYYSIYNSVLSLFFKCGIKCENHSGAIILIKELFGLNELYLIFSGFKKDRIDNQYYVQTVNNDEINKENCLGRINTAKEFNMKIRAYLNNLKNQEINKIRRQFKILLFVKNYSSNIFT